MIGAGVFTSLGFQVADLRSDLSILLVWGIGGLVALCGAASYAELGAALPRSGGEYHLLGRTWHPLAGFLAGWLSMTVGFAAPVALSCAAFGAYVGEALLGGGRSAQLLCASGLLLALTAVHLIDLRVSSRFQAAATGLKAALILALIGAAAAGGDAGRLELTVEPREWVSAPFAVALFFVSYSYSGWNAAVYVAGEMSNPQRDLPRALLLGTGAVTLLYVLLNAAFLASAPREALSGQIEVGLVAARHLFGEEGGRLVGLLIAAGLVSTVSAMLWAGPRVAQMMGEDWALLRPLSRTTGRGIPWAATLLQAGIALALLWGGGFREVLVYIEFTLLLSTFLTVAGVFWLRWKEPELPRPFRTWGYPFTPLIYLLFTGYALVRVGSSPGQWLQSALGLATVLGGAGLYLLARRSISRASWQ